MTIQLTEAMCFWGKWGLARAPSIELLMQVIKFEPSMFAMAEIDWWFHWHTYLFIVCSAFLSYLHNPNSIQRYWEAIDDRHTYMYELFDMFPVFWIVDDVNVASHWQSLEASTISYLTPPAENAGLYKAGRCQRNSWPETIVRGVLTTRRILCLVRLYQREVLQIKITVALLTSMSWIRSLFGFVTRHWNPRWSKLMSSNSDQYQWNKYQSASNQNLPQVSSIFATGKKHMKHHLGSPFSCRHLRL